MNLVSNAVKFTSEGGVAVAASVAARDNSHAVVHIEVSDTGIGIDPAVRDQMFEPFTQADASTTRIYGGTGLGLAIASELTELMGGAIGAESGAEAGTTFWLDLPLLAATTGVAERSDPAGRDAAAGQSWSTPPLVLVAEDSPVNQIVAVRSLERLGCRADVVADGQEALDALSKTDYDVVLMDCQMPRMDGYQATIELRRRESGRRHTPVIAMTAHVLEGAREACEEAGMDDYLSKPIARDLLNETLRRWIPDLAATA
jgi:CheY-like chemotaxis protein